MNFYGKCLVNSNSSESVVVIKIGISIEGVVVDGDEAKSN
jgi:hypothetical protein